MIKNFGKIKEQLIELSEVINSFKSEQVQLRIVELMLGSDEASAPEATPEAVEMPIVRRGRKPKQSAYIQQPSKIRRTRSKDRPGPSRAAVSSAFLKGWRRLASWMPIFNGGMVFFQFDCSVRLSSVGHSWPVRFEFTSRGLLVACLPVPGAPGGQATPGPQNSAPVERRVGRTVAVRDWRHGGGSTRVTLVWKGSRIGVEFNFRPLGGRCPPNLKARRCTGLPLLLARPVNGFIGIRARCEGESIDGGSGLARKTAIPAVPTPQTVPNDQQSENTYRGQIDDELGHFHHHLKTGVKESA